MTAPKPPSPAPVERFTRSRLVAVLYPNCGAIRSNAASIASRTCVDVIADVLRLISRCVISRDASQVKWYHTVTAEVSVYA